MKVHFHSFRMSLQASVSFFVASVWTTDVCTAVINLSVSHSQLICHDVEKITNLSKSEFVLAAIIL